MTPEFIECDDPIDVITVFKKDKIKPVRFKTSHQEYNIKEITYRWTSHEGKFIRYHFSVVTDTDDNYEIYLHTKDMRWTLSKISLEG